MHTLPYLNMWLAGSKCGCSEKVHQCSLYHLRVLPCFLYLDTRTLSRGASSAPNSHWTDYIYVGYSLTLTPRWSFLGRRGRWGWRSFPTSKRLCVKAQKRSTTSLTQFHCQSPCQPHPSPSSRGHPDGRKSRLSPSPQTLAKYQPGQNPTGMWISPGDTRSWLWGYDDQADQVCQDAWGDSEHKWLKRQMPPFMWSLLRWAELTQSSCCLGASPLTVPLHYMSDALATTAGNRKRTFQQPSLNLSWRAHRLWMSSDSPAHQNWDSASSRTSLTRYLFLLALPQLGALICWVHCQSCTEKTRTAFPAAHSAIIIIKGPMLTSKRLRLGVNTALAQNEDRTCTCIDITWLGPAPNHKGRNLPVPLPVKPRPPADHDNGTVGEALRSTRDLDSESNTVNHSGTSSDSDASRENCGLTLIRSQPPGIVSVVHTQMMVTIRTTHKKYRNRVLASSSLEKGCLWSEAQLK